MKSFTDASIKQKLTQIIMLTTCVSLLLACGAFLAYESVAFKQATLRDLTTLARTVGDNCAPAVQFMDKKTAEDALSTLKTEPHIVAAAVYAPDGTPFATYKREKGKSLGPSPFSRQQYAQFRNGNLVVLKNIPIKGKTAAVVCLTYDMGEMHARLMRYAGIAFMVLLVSSLVALALSSRMQSIISKPILRLAETADPLRRRRTTPSAQTTAEGMR